MRKVLIVITTAFVPTGGLTSVMMNYYRNIDKHQLRIDFTSTNNPPKHLLDELAINGSCYFQLPPRYNILKYFNALKKICYDYDVVHVNGNSATSTIELLAARMANVRVRIAHNHNTMTDHPIIHRLLLPFFRKSYTHALACSKEAGNWLFGKDQFCVLKNAIDVKKYCFRKESRENARKEFGIEQDSFVIGHVGKYNTQKNHYKLIDVFYEYQQTHKNVFLVAVGYGPLEKSLRTRVEELGIKNKVYFTGERMDIPELLSMMDIFIFPSLWEGLGMAVIEAQASGLPCLLSDIVPQEVCITSKVEYLSIELESQKWAKKIDEMIVSDRDRQCAYNMRLISERGYDITLEAKELYKLYIE